MLIALLRGSFGGVNSEVNLWAATLHTGSFTVVAKIVAENFETTPLLIISFLVGIVLFLLKMKRSAFLLIGAMVGDALILEALKTLINSPRPSNELLLETGNSFPSGHVTSTVVLFGILTFLCWQIWKSTKAKVTFSTLLMVISLFVGFTRIYLNVHWLSDVLAGYLLGLFWLTFCLAVTPYVVKSYKKQQS